MRDVSRAVDELAGFQAHPPIGKQEVRLARQKHQDLFLVLPLWRMRTLTVRQDRRMAGEIADVDGAAGEQLVRRDADWVDTVA